MSLGTAVLNSVIGYGDDALDAVYGTLMGSWPAQTIIALYVIVVGYKVIMGHAGDRWKQWTASALILLVLGSLTATQGGYAEWIADPIYEIAYSLAAVGAGNTEAGSVSGLFDAMEANLRTISDVVRNGEAPGNPITNFWVFIQTGVGMLVLMALGVAMYLVLIALLSIAFFSLFMMLVAGGPCLWLASFAETRGVTWAWLKALANYSVWIFFLGVGAAASNSLAADTMTDLMNWDVEADSIFSAKIGGPLLIYALSVYMMLKAAEWAAAITGGTSMNTGIIGAVGSAGAGLMQSGLSMLGGAVGGAAKWAGGAAINKIPAAAAAYRAFSALRGIGKVN